MIYPINKIGTLLLACLLFTACHRQEDPVLNPLTIRAVTVPGVPEAVITIDHLSRELVIGIPVSSTVARIAPAYEMACSNCTGPPQKVIERCNDQAVYRDNLPVQPLGSIMTFPYSLMVKSIGDPGQLSVTIAPQSLTANAGYGLVLTGSHYFDGSPTQFVFTSTATGQEFSATERCGYGDRYGPFAGPLTTDQFVGPSPENAPPGTYSVSVVKTNGRRFQIPQTVTLTKALPVTYTDPYSPPIRGITTLALRGRNLFANDALELQIKTRSGKTYRLPTQNHAADGTTAQLVVPADIEPGDYIAQFFRNGQPTLAYVPLTFLADNRQPAFVSFYKAFDFPDGPLILHKARPQPFTFVLRSVDYSQFKTARVRLMPVNGSGNPVFIEVPVPDSFLKGGPDAGGLPTFTIPQTVADGRYLLYLQYVNHDGSIRESEPFAVEAEVRP